MRELRFYVYNVRHAEPIRTTWALLTAKAPLPLLLPTKPKSGSVTAYAYITRIYIAENFERVRAACYCFAMDTLKAATFFGAVAQTATQGVRFVIRDTMTRHWFEAQLREQDPEVVKRVRSVMGSPALPEGHKWVRGEGRPQPYDTFAGLGPETPPTTPDQDI